MRILITGATGQIGKKLTAALENSGHQVRILIRNSQPSQKTFSNKTEFAIGDLQNTETLEKALVNVNTIIHLAAITHTNDHESYYRINTKGTENILRAAEKKGISNFIFISSRTASAEGGAYAHSKLLAEEAVKKTALNWVILRPSEVYGASTEEAISKLVNIIKISPVVPIIGDGNYLLNPVHVDDLIQTIAVITYNNVYSKKIYNIAGPEEISYNNLVDKIAKIFNLKRTKIHIPVSLAEHAAYLFSLLGMNILVRDQIPRLLSPKTGNITEAKNDLGFNPRSLEDGLNAE